MGTYNFYIPEAKFCLNKTQLKIITEAVFIIRVIIHHKVFFFATYNSFQPPL